MVMTRADYDAAQEALREQIRDARKRVQNAQTDFHQLCQQSETLRRTFYAQQARQ